MLSPGKESKMGTILSLMGLILLFNVGGSILTEQVKTPSGFLFNTATCVVAQELVKLSISCIAFSRKVSSPEGARYTLELSQLLKFSTPALLYAVCNIINWEIIKYLTAAQFQVFNNGKIVITAFVFRMFLGRELKMFQWFSVVILCLGMIVTSLPGPGEQVSTTEEINSGFAYGLFLMLINCIASSFAGVYNEFLLKSGKDDTNFQNMQLYFWGVLVCLIKFVYEGNSLTPSSFFNGWSPMIFLIVLVNAMYGQVIALTFKYGDNMVKVNANSIASIASALVSWLIWGDEISFPFAVGSIIVCLAVRTYYCDPKQLVQTDTEYTGIGVEEIAKDVEL